MTHETQRPPRRVEVSGTVHTTAPMSHSTPYEPGRKHWPGLVAAGVLGAAIAAVIVSNQYDGRSLGERLDAGIDVAGRTVDHGVQDVREGAAAVADAGASIGDRVATKVGDASITASVNAALAADPALSAMKIDVDTRDGVVSLDGPAPNAAARERATVLAAAPEGVVGVDNRLRVTSSRVAAASPEQAAALPAPQESTTRMAMPAPTEPPPVDALPSTPPAVEPSTPQPSTGAGSTTSPEPTPMPLPPPTPLPSTETPPAPAVPSTERPQVPAPTPAPAPVPETATEAPSSGT